MFNKRGYLKILEAIIALIVVFSFLVVMLPKSKVVEDTSQMPLELKSTVDTIIKSLQENNDRRISILLDAENIRNQDTIKEAVTDTIEEILPIFTTWDYAFSVKCMRQSTTNTEEQCDPDNKYFYNSHPFNVPEIENTDSSFTDSLPKDRNIYAKTLFITVTDVTEKGDTPPTDFYKELTIYFWSKT